MKSTKKGYPSGGPELAGRLDNFLWINGVAEIKWLIASEQNTLKREIQDINYELESIREKIVKGNIYLYKSLGGEWKYLGRKNKGKDHIAKLEKDREDKHNQQQETEALILSAIIHKLPEDGNKSNPKHLIVSKRFKQGGFIKLRDIISYPSRVPGSRPKMDNSKKKRGKAT